MAANPLPPQGPTTREPTTVQPKAPGHFPWGLVAGILVLIALGLIAYYFFR